MNSVYVDKNQCSGCSQCYNLCPKAAIAMLPDEEGFSYPTIDQDKCVDCGICRDSCAFLNGETLKNTEENTFYIAKHKDRQVLEQSTSGGAFTALSDIMLERGGVVYGVDFDSRFNVCHVRANSAAGRDKMRISKYAQSDMSDIFKRVKSDLKNGTEVLFTGTPCQVAGLKAFIGDGATADKLYLCDVICHSIPSPLVWQEYKNLLEKENGKKLGQVYFRSKSLDWTRGNSNRAFTYVLEDEQVLHTDNRFYQLFFGEGCIMRPSCERCPFTEEKRVSDITIADYWGIEKYDESLYDKKGVSVIITSTQKGGGLLELAKDALGAEKRDKREQLTEQKRLSEPVVFPATRAEFWQEYKEHGFEYISDKLKEKYR